MSETDKIWEQFCNKFDEALFDCAEKGNAAKMTIGIGASDVTVEIYRDKGDMVRLTNIVTSAMKPQGVVK